MSKQVVIDKLKVNGTEFMYRLETDGTTISVTVPFMALSPCYIDKQGAIRLATRILNLLEQADAQASPGEEKK